MRRDVNDTNHKEARMARILTISPQACGEYRIRAGHITAGIQDMTLTVDEMRTLRDMLTDRLDLIDTVEEPRGTGAYTTCDGDVLLHSRDEGDSLWRTVDEYGHTGQPMTWAETLDLLGHTAAESLTPVRAAR